MASFGIEEQPEVAHSENEDVFALEEPLLHFSGVDNRMEVSQPTASSSSERSAMGRLLQVPVLRSCLMWLLGIRTVSDAFLPAPIHAVATSGKLSFAVFIGIYLFFVAIWLPLWLMTFLIGEIGFYIALFATVFGAGRAVLRLVALPGASNRVQGEIEKEFSKYSVKMLIAASGSILDLGSMLMEIAKDGGGTAPATNFRYYEIPGMWNRVASYRDRVLAVFAQVLSYILESDDQKCDPNSSLTKYKNNVLSGDIGDLTGLTLQAREDGKELLKLLKATLLELDRLEEQASVVLRGNSGKPTPMQPAARMTVTQLLLVASELRDFVTSLRPASDPDSVTPDEDENLTVDAVRRKFEEPGGGSPMDAIQAGAASILPMLDPPLHTSIFGFDLQRGCMLARYVGARQVWVPRPSGGMVDVLHIPAKGGVRGNKRAVLYCNPNAGLIEVATGMSLAGGNVASEVDGVVNDNCWADFYTNMGFDIYLFNYAGFGRSYGTTFCAGKRGGEEPFIPGIMGRIRRICHGTFFNFKPTPDTLRADGLAVANYIVQTGVDSLVIHGESIGGVAASGAARSLSTSSSSRDVISLLVCDRTFCNLEAVAQRLVGGWSGYAIRALAPLWNTDVAADFLASTCPKVVATDCADTIISDSSSLKSGIAFWKEIHKGALSTKGVGWKMDAPLEYRMADWENVCVNDSRYVQSSYTRSQPPVWPRDKHITIEEAFHFAACTKRIGKLASFERKRYTENMRGAVDETGFDSGSGCQSPLFLIWKVLGCCDGLCGSALGVAVRGGFDVTATWLCSCLIYGGQTVVDALEKRTSADLATPPTECVSPKDFDCRPPGYEQHESESVVHPKPIPEVLESVRTVLDENKSDEVLASVQHEVTFVIGTLEYVVARLSSPSVVEQNWRNRHLKENAPNSVGSFLNLHCGHNNPFSPEEKKRLGALVSQATTR